MVHTIIQTHNVSAIFLEDIQLRVNVSAFKKLAMLQGILSASLERNNYLYDYIQPSQWQNYCKARGRSTKEKKQNVTQQKENKKQSKELSIQFVKEQFNIHTDNDNLADAICMGWYIVNNKTIHSR